MSGFRIMALALCALAWAPANAGWQVEHNVDELTDVGTVVAIYNGYPHTAVGVVCSTQDGWMQVNIDFGGFLNTGGDPVPFRYRIDKGPLLSARGEVATQNHRIAFLAGDHAAKFARGLLGGGVLIAEATAYDDERHRVRVPLAGADARIMEVLDACAQSPEQAAAREVAEREAMRRKVEVDKRRAAESRRLFEERQRERDEANRRYERERKGNPRPIPAEQADANHRARDMRTGEVRGRGPIRGAIGRTRTGGTG